MARRYSEYEIKVLSKEIADYFINETKERGVVNIDDLVLHMKKNYAVPEELTTGVIIMTLQSLPFLLVNLHDSV